MTIQEVGDTLLKHDKGWLPIDRGATYQTWEHPVHGIVYVRQAPWDENLIQFRPSTGRPVFSEWQEDDYYNSVEQALRRKR